MGILHFLFSRQYFSKVVYLHQNHSEHWLKKKKTKIAGSGPLLHISESESLMDSLQAKIKIQELLG